MRKRAAQIWAIAIAIAVVCAYFGFRANPKQWGLFLQFPGIVAGLLLGYLARLRSPAMTRALVLATTVIVNSLWYYWLCRLVLFAGRRKGGTQKSRSME